VRPRVVHIGTSLAIVVVAYWTYALLAVPLIEPPAESPHSFSDGPNGGPPPPPPITKHLAGLFPPGSWVFQDPRVLLSENALLLMQKYENLGEGWVDLSPLVVLFLPEEPNLEFPERVRRATILEAPEGAKVRFDQPVSLARLRLGRPVEGKLRGPVTLRRQGQRPDHADDLLVTGREVELNEERIWTPHEVDFRWGRSYARGRQMEIRLRPREGPGKKGHAGPNVGGIEQFEFQSLDLLHLDMAAAKDTPDGAGPRPAAAAGPRTTTRGAAAGAANRPAPGAGRGVAALGAGAGAIEVRCRGPFHFHLVRQVATFRDQVDLVRIRAPAENDRLQCELLSVYFAQAQRTGKPTGNQAEVAQRRNLGLDLEPRRLVAQGHPATFSAPADKVFARGEHIEYDLQSGMMALADPQEAVLRQGPNEIHTPSFRYDPAEPGHLGQAWAKGPGYVRGLMADRPGQPFVAQWLEQLEIRPEGQYHRASLTGGASVRSEGGGKLDARQIHLWLLEAAPAGGRGQGHLQPDRMLALGDVKFDSLQLSGAVERMEVYFTPAPPAPAGPGAAAPGAAVPAARTRETPAPQVTPAGTPSPPGTPNPAGRDPRGAPTGAPVGPAVGPLAGAPAGPQHLDIQGRLMVAHMLLDDQHKTTLAALTVDGNVRCVQTQPAGAPSGSGEQPVRIFGERLEMTDANLPGATGVVTGAPSGAPAHFEGRGISLNGSNIHFHRGQNRVWIDGVGWMLLPMDKKLDGSPLERPVPLRVDWRRRMEFDGLTTHFEGDVTATGPSQQLRTPVMDVRLQRPLVFTEPNPRQPPQVEQIYCRGGVSMESQTFEDRPEGPWRIAYDRMAVPDLAVNMITGVLGTGGPGWLIDVRRGSAGIARPHAGPARVARPPGAPVGIAGPQAGPARVAKPHAAANSAQLMGLHVRFLGSITGNVLTKEMTFHDQVRAAYAPVSDWRATLESDNPEVLGPGAAVLHSDHLTVTDVGPTAPAAAAGGNGHAELLAAGNVVAEGSTPTEKGALVRYTARAARMSYSQRTDLADLAVLEGDGRTDAELFREEHIGSEPVRLAAQKIYYWPQQNRTSVEGARQLNLLQMPGPNWVPPPKPAPLTPAPRR
jgi:lipopolysaccharide export system protein LptA